MTRTCPCYVQGTLWYKVWRTCWHDNLFDILHQMDFKPSRADPDIWMKSSRDGNHYEYISVYIDDFAMCMKVPQSFCDTLKEKYKLKLQGFGPSWMWIYQR